jgi:hypothetical protein
VINGALLLLAVCTLVAGCGGSGRSGAGVTSAAGTTTTAGATPSSGSALTAEADQAAAGDIPDNQVFLTFRNAAAGYAIKVPEGWARQGAAAGVTFRDKNNLVRIEVAGGSKPTVAGATAELRRLQRQTPSLRFDPPAETTVAGRPAVKAVYTTESTPNPVTGKRVKLVVDRYYVPGAGKHAVVDLATPQGVDNVDAYRLMIESFRWR